MEENTLIEEQDFMPQPPSLPEPRVRLVLLAQIGLMIFCSGIGVMLYYMICILAGWDPSMALHADSPLAERWQMRMQLGLTHMFGFLVAGSVTVWIFYRGITQTQVSWPDYLKARQRPPWSELLLGILLMAVSMPLVLYTLSLNQQFPLPEMFKTVGNQAEEALKGLLHMDSVAELLANITLVALLPALGEELVFRGVVQQQLMRRIANPWVAILVSAAIFSAAHFQFDGFLPRMLHKQRGCPPKEAAPRHKLACFIDRLLIPPNPLGKATHYLRLVVIQAFVLSSWETTRDFVDRSSCVWRKRWYIGTTPI